MSASHLVEIDLLRQGLRVPMRDPLPPAPYFVLVSRAESRPLADVWPVHLNQPLPRIPVPLLPGDANVPLELRAAFSSVYDVVGYELIVDYNRPAEVALSPQDALWAQEQLRAPRSSRNS